MTVGDRYNTAVTTIFDLITATTQLAHANMSVRH